MAGSLRGRDTELATVSALIAAATDDPFVAVIEGEAGIGKSTLLAAAVEIAGAGGLLVIVASAHELEQDRPFGPLIDALDLRSDVADEGAMRHVVVDGITDALQALGDERPVLLAVEDLHFADASTLVALGRIARSRAHLAVSLLCTTRPTGGVPERDALLRTLEAEGAHRIAVGPLDDEVVREVIADLAGGAPGPNLLARLGGAAGNPLYIVEVIRTLQQDGVLQITGDVAETAGTDLPASVRQTGRSSGRSAWRTPR